MVASYEGHLEVVRLLLEQPSIDVNANDKVSDDMIYGVVVL
jgi:hypothetical protein